MPMGRSPMSTSKFGLLFSLVVLCASVQVSSAQGPDSQSPNSQSPNLGRPLTPEEIRKFDITIEPDGKGLPPGQGSVADGTRVYSEKCQMCHGARGQGGPQDRLTGGVGTLASSKPVKTPVSYWPAATTIFDYVRRAMPLQAPESLTNDEVYAVTAYILSIDGVVSEDAVLDAKSLPQVKMPNRDGFDRWWPVPQPKAASGK
jgi:S-disulfanyl-L-cysteine oxidoreductase SoxD